MNEIIEIRDLDIPRLKEKYLEYIDVAKKTSETYNIALNQFAKYLVSNDIKKPRRDDVIAFRDDLKNTHSVATINSYLVAIRNFFRFLASNGIYEDITIGVKRLKDTTLHKREAVELNDCQKIYNSTNNLREKVVFSLALFCGLRANEIVNIEISDFKYEEGQYRLYVLGKGRNAKTDYVIVPDSVIEEIKKYVEEYHITHYLIVSTSNNNFGGKVTVRTMERIVNNMYERVGIKRDTIVFHSLRHSFATISIENGQDIREVSRAMRHKSVTVTERYLHDMEMRNNKCSNIVSSLLI